MSTGVTISPAPTYDPAMAGTARPGWAETTTDKARTEITALVAAERRAHAAWQDAVRERDEALERHHALGVIPRDLSPLTVTDDDPEGLHTASISRIVRAVRVRREQSASGEA